MQVRRLLLLASATATAAVVVVATATGSSALNFKPTCVSGPIRCMDLLRTDIPIVQQAQAAHSGYGPADLHAAYNLPTGAGAGQTVAVVDA